MMSKIGRKSAILIFFLSLAIGSASAQEGDPKGEPFPQLPKYPEPIQSLTEKSAGELIFSSFWVIDFPSLLLEDQSNLPIRVQGKLFLPDSASRENPVSAMVILSGSSGIHQSREIAYGQWLKSQNIAAFVIDSFAARGMQKEHPESIRLLLVSEADEVADGYSALKLLAKHPAIDKNRIGTMGFSYGGTASRCALDARIRQNLAPDLPPFALHLDFYGPCYFDIGTKKTTGKPFFSFRGAKDASNDLVRCAQVEKSLRKAGSLVGTYVFASAGHGWEIDWPREFQRAFNPAPIWAELKEDGNWIINGMKFSRPKSLAFGDKIALRRKQFESLHATQDPNAGYIIGRDEETHKEAQQQALKILSRFLSENH
jgi:dienelactone hydrolase